MALERHLNWEACYNARDMGGYETNSGTQTRWRSIVRADNLCRLTPAGCGALLDYGVRTIIDLRSGEELLKAPHPFAEHNHGVTYLNLPLLDPADREGMAALSDSETPRENYCFMLGHFRARFAGVIRAIANAEPGGVLFHCFAGKDRTGLISALILSIVGVPAATIAADYALTDLYLQTLYAELRASAEPARRQRVEGWLVSPPETMRAVLSHLDHHYGGARSYLLAAGVTVEELDRIRDRFCE